MDTLSKVCYCDKVQRWSLGHKARGQGQGHKKIRGQDQGQPFRGQTLSRPRTGMLEAKAKDTSASALQKKKKKKKGLHKNFSSDLHKKTFSKKIFKRFTKFQQFKKQCCPRAEDRPIFEDLRPRGQGQGLDLRGQDQGQGLQNVSSRTSSRPRTSSRTPPLIRFLKCTIPIGGTSPLIVNPLLTKLTFSLTR